ncbi:DUF3667 domain-containing protein [uncultured Erythrobacter sp.]|uniref:DUF3667 domain-containing protein n=1 Tax=uncultured Erythrobacter sp. TaxID=263913 RepID=UPI00263675AF|nr:DUF3667 domain-containing protein [uncultured Erythrobacter sp.]
MSDIAEGLGAVVEGALVGRAVEPAQGEGSCEIADPSPEDCANCGASISTAFCPQCGQKRKVHRSIAAISHDLIHGVLHLDGKFWKTLPLLVFKPGKLTRRYINGERAKFVSPMAMFLFSVFAMFAVFQMVGISAPSDIGSETDLNRSTELMRDEAQEGLDDREARLASMSANDPERVQVEAEIEQLKESLSGIDEIEKLTFNFNQSVDEEASGIEFIDNAVKKWRDNPGLMIYKLQSNAYKFSWLLIPLSIPFMWLIFAWKRRFKAYDHAIFVTYSLAFMSMLFIAVSLLGTAGAPPPFVVFPLLIVPPLHIYKQLRGTYELSRFSALWRLLVMSIFIWVVVGLFFQSLIFLGAL